MPWVNIFLLVLPFVVVRAHYNLISPQPYNRIDCNAPRCRGPCPPIWRSGRSRARNSPQRPAAVWRRGDVKEISWHRNNHEGGFVRMSLVPVKYMNNHLWHKKTAFAYSCFATNKYYCGKNKRCGTDQRGHAFRTWVRIPQILPDGDYVFSHTWAGGLHWRRRRAFFSDYYTCSFIRIRGGPVKQRYQPTFNAGRSRHRYVNRKGGVCASTSRYVGECGGMECLKNPVGLRSRKNLMRSEAKHGKVKSIKDMPFKKRTRTQRNTLLTSLKNEGLLERRNEVATSNILRHVYILIYI